MRTTKTIEVMLYNILKKHNFKKFKLDKYIIEPVVAVVDDELVGFTYCNDPDSIIVNVYGLDDNNLVQIEFFKDGTTKHSPRKANIKPLLDKLKYD